MKFSESWLRSFVDPAIEGEAFSHLLTMAGLEVEEEESVAPAFDSVIVGQVLEVTKHPDADRLNVCRVDIGRGEAQQIVCGAPNVAAGLKVPCALPGANLPGDFKIKIAKVRGIEIGFSGAITPKWNVFGGYTFMDFVRVGVPLAILTGIVCVALVPWILPP